jgi:aryl-phospho-beta-D-glucosidase BglC (GH1 family)
MRISLASLALAAACSSHSAVSTTDAPATGGGDAAGSGSSSGGLRVVMGSGGSNGQIVDASGTPVHLHGADRSGTEYSCLNGTIFDGAVDQPSIDAMKSWHINAVRVPLNEDCWLGINGVPGASSGSAYQAAIRGFVTLLEQNDLYVILDLHWAAPGTDKANGQLGMADADHAPTFWSQVAAAYAGDHARVIFDLFNEPFITDWDCWLHGGACAQSGSNATYTAAGMAQLLQAVRGAGADNVVILGGLAYASDFSQWVAKVTSIPSASNVAASWHAYSDQSVQTLCPTQYNNYDPSLTCASGSATAANYGVPPVLAAGFPVVIGEIGIGAYASSIAPYTDAQGQELDAWLDGMLTWMEGQGQGYLAWDWSVDAPPLLVTDDRTGSATPYFGVTYKAHLAGL